MSHDPWAHTRAAIRIALAVVTVAAAVFSLVPNLPDPLRAFRFMLHPLSYALFTVIYLMAAVWDPWTGPRRWPRGVPGIVAGVTCGGIALELAQMLTTRGADLSDIIGNIVGVTVGSVAWVMLRKTWDGEDLRRSRSVAMS